MDNIYTIVGISRGIDDEGVQVDFINYNGDKISWTFPISKTNEVASLFMKDVVLNLTFKKPERKSK